MLHCKNVETKKKILHKLHFPLLTFQVTFSYISLTNFFKFLLFFFIASVQI